MDLRRGYSWYKYLTLTVHTTFSLPLIPILVGELFMKLSFCPISFRLTLGKGAFPVIWLLLPRGIETLGPRKGMENERAGQGKLTLPVETSDAVSHLCLLFP